MFSANVIPERFYWPARRTKCALAGGESYLERTIKIPLDIVGTGMTNKRALPTRSRSHPECSERSAIVNQILRPEKAGLRMTDSLSGNPPLSKPPTGFSESDVGEPPDMECDIGRALDELASSELERTW